VECLGQLDYAPPKMNRNPPDRPSPCSLQGRNGIAADDRGKNFTPIKYAPRFLTWDTVWAKKWALAPQEVVEQVFEILGPRRF